MPFNGTFIKYPLVKCVQKCSHKNRCARTCVITFLYKRRIRVLRIVMTESETQIDMIMIFSTRHHNLIGGLELVHNAINN